MFVYINLLWLKSIFYAYVNHYLLRHLSSNGIFLLAHVSFESVHQIKIANLVWLSKSPAVENVVSQLLQRNLVSSCDCVRSLELFDRLLD